MSDRFHVRSEILSAIGKTDDTNLKMVLLLLLGVLEEIGGKIDAFMSDERKLRETVLNGHEPQHHAHHDHVARCIAEDCMGACEWAKVKMREEADDAASKKGMKQQFLEAVVAQAGTIAVAIIAGVLGMGYYLK